MGIIMGIAMLGNNPEALVDITLRVLEFFPAWVGFFVRGLLTRTAQRLSDAFIPGHSYNYTTGVVNASNDSSLGVITSFSVLLLAVLWRAPQG